VKRFVRADDRLTAGERSACDPAVPEFDAGDGEEPAESGVSAAATPCPVVTATPRPNATARPPSRDEFFGVTMATSSQRRRLPGASRFVALGCSLKLIYIRASIRLPKSADCFAQFQKDCGVLVEWSPLPTLLFAIVRPVLLPH
jgi:hypothetical protein